MGTIAKAQQTVLLKPINVSQIALLPTEKLDFWNRLDALSYKKNLSVVKVGDVPSLQQNGTLTFTIPGVAATITAKAVRVEYEAEKQYIWQGSIDQAGYMSIVSTADGMSGFIQLNNKYFVLYPLYKSYCALFEYNLSAMPADTCVTGIVPTATLQSTSSSIDYCADDYNCHSTIDVLVLITPEARTWIGGTFGNNWLNALAYVINGTETVNLAFANSDINARVRTRYAALNDFVYSISNDADEDILSLKNHTTAQNLRNQHRADLVIMLTNDRYATVAGTVSAIGPDVADYDDAYGIVEINSLLDPRFTYAHEVAHLFGARHNRSGNGGNDNTDICAHGLQFDDADGIERRTIMALLYQQDQQAGNQRVLHYSNPDINFNGTPTGNANNNNAHMIQNTGCELVGYRSSPYFSAAIDGYKMWCRPGTSVTELPNDYVAVITPATPGFPCTPPYTYEWRWNTSGIFTAANPGTLLGNTASITINELLTCPSFFLRLRITGADGFSYTVTNQIDTHFCCGGGGGKNLFSDTQQTNMFQVMPNPAQTDFRVVSQQLPKGSYQLQLLDAMGSVVLREDCTIENSTDAMSTFNVDKLTTGLYYLRVFGNNASYYQKILINH